MVVSYSSLFQSKVLFKYVGSVRPRAALINIVRKQWFTNQASFKGELSLKLPHVFVCLTDWDISKNLCKQN